MSIPEVKRLAADITTYEQGVAALRLALDLNAKAERRAIQGFTGFFEQQAQNSAIRLVRNNMAYIERILDEMPVAVGAIDDRTKARISLALEQATEAFQIIDNLAGSTSLVKDLLDGLQAVLEAVLGAALNNVLKPIAKATWPIWVGAGVVLLVLMVVRFK